MTAGYQYDRKASLIVASKTEQMELSELRFRFDVKRGDIETPNTADITIYNLDDDNASTLASENTQYKYLILNGGYQDANYGLVFLGNIRQVRRGRDSPVDTTVSITASDGDYQTLWGKVKVSINAGSTAAQRYDLITKAMMAQNQNGAIPLIAAPPPNFSDSGLPRGKVFFGSAAAYMRELAMNAGATWSIQNGKIYVNGLTTANTNDPIPLTPATGLIGVPEQLVSGFHFKCLLNPNIQTNSVIKIDNNLIQQYRYPIDLKGQAQKQFVPMTNANGLYRVIYSEHTGDTRGQQWYTDMVCLSVDSTATPPSQLSKVAGIPNLGNVKALPGGN